MRSLRASYTAIGFLLGVGAPVGALLTRFMFMPQVRSAPFADLAANRFFYIYQLVGSCIVFALAGWVAGGHAERLRDAESFYHALAEHDPLTGLYNARAFRNRYGRSLERAARMRQPLSLLLIDVDFLKRINDRFGHAMGNKALLHVANSLREAKRAEDSAARWGGDEFAILLDGADPSAARRVAEKVLAQVRQTPVPFTRGRLTVTVSVGGCTAFNVTADSDLFATADRELYSAKHAGRDRASIAEIGAADSTGR